MTFKMSLKFFFFQSISTKNTVVFDNYGKKRASLVFVVITLEMCVSVTSLFLL